MTTATEAVQLIREKLPYAVVDTDSLSDSGNVKLLALFAEVDHASLFIGALPDAEGVRLGRYAIDGPSDD